MKDRPKPAKAPSQSQTGRRTGHGGCRDLLPHTLQGAGWRAGTDVLPRPERGQGKRQDAADGLRRRRTGEASDGAGLLSRKADALGAVPQVSAGTLQRNGDPSRNQGRQTRLDDRQSSQRREGAEVPGDAGRQAHVPASGLRLRTRRLS